MTHSHPSLQGPKTSEGTEIPGWVDPTPRPFRLTLHSGQPVSHEPSKHLIRIWDCFPEGPWAIPVHPIPGEKFLRAGPYDLTFEYVAGPVEISWYAIWPPFDSRWDGLCWRVKMNTCALDSGAVFSLHVNVRLMLP